MADIKTFIIIEGLLHESGEFDLRRGYEAARADPAWRDDAGDSWVEIALLDDTGQRLAAVRPRIHFPAGCEPRVTTAGVGLVRAAVGYHPEARRLAVLVRGREAFAAEVAEKPPALKASVGSRAQDHLPVMVDAPGADIRIVARLASGRRIRPEARIDGNTHVLDLRSVEGLGTAEIVVEATAGLRTTRAVATQVRLPDATVQGRIIEPHRERWPWGWRGSLMANLSDRNARPIEWKDHTVGWRINGDELDDTRQVVGWHAPDAGAYEIELIRHLGDGRVDVLDRKTLTVDEQTAAQKEYVAAVGAFRRRRDLA